MKTSVRRANGGAGSSIAVTLDQASPSGLALMAPEPCLAGPLAASALASAIAAFWEDAMARGEVDASQPLDVLDLVPGRGQMVWQMLQALQQRLDLISEWRPRLRYLAAAPQRSMLAVLRNQPELQPWIAAEILVPTLWDPERGFPCLLNVSGRQAWHPANPAAVLAHDRWSSLAQRLLAIHYGALLEADLDLMARAAPAQGQGQEQQRLWRPCAGIQSEAGMGALVRPYLEQFNSTPLPLPVGALGAIGRIMAAAAQGYLIVAAGHGIACERDLRLCSFDALAHEYARKQKLPLNFHLLARHYQAMGASSTEWELHPGLVLQLSVGALFEPERRLPRIRAALAREGGDIHMLAEALPILVEQRGKLPAALALLRQSGHDPEVFGLAGASLPLALRDMASGQREAWSAALERVWQQHLPVAGARPLHRDLSAAAMQVGNWSLARRVLLRGMKAHGETAPDLAHLAWCEMRTGHMEKAHVLARRALAREPDHATAREVLARIVARLESRDAAWRQDIRHPSQPLTLEPLDISHAAALCYQYRDPQIAVMTGLPALSSEDEARAWIRRHTAETGREAYAILHGDHGFVGYIGLALSGPEAYFCFWIGVDFQGCRLAGVSSRLLFDFARTQGIHTIFTSVYDDNARSLRTIERIGFLPLALRAQAPEHDRRFFYLRLEPGRQGEPEAELLDYCRREDLPIAFQVEAADLICAQ